MAAYSFVFRSHVGNSAEVADVLRAEARGQVAEFPQYGSAHFDRYRLGRVTRTVRTKAGLAAEAGDLVLVRYESFAGKVSAVFWSRNSGCDTSVPAPAVVLVGSVTS